MLRRNPNLKPSAFASMFVFAFASFGLTQSAQAHTSLASASTTATSEPVKVKSMLAEVRPNHVVIVIEENHSYSQIRGNRQAPYINYLMEHGANFTNYHGAEHPSEPNYLDLFSGGNQGVTDDSVPHTFSAPNLASELLAHQWTFKGYSEDLPWTGYQGVTNVEFTYARKHNPWVDFTNVPSSDNLSFSLFPRNFSELPTIAIVVPNLNHDMHNGTMAMGDAWLNTHIGAYAQWAKSHNSLLVVTWDEDDGSTVNNIPTVFFGAKVRAGNYRESLNHFNLLNTIEEFYGIPRIGHSKSAKPINDVWKP